MTVVSCNPAVMPHWCSRHPAAVQSGIFPYYSLHFPQALGSAHSRIRLQKYLHSHFFYCAVFYLCPRYFSPSGYFLFYFLYQLPSDSEMLSSRLSSFLVITLEITIQRLIRKIALSELSFCPLRLYRPINITKSSYECKHSKRP